MPLKDLEERYFPRSGTEDAAPFSRGSTFKPLIDGPAYFGAIKAAIDSLRDGDTCYIAGWSLSPDFTFADGITLGDVLAEKAAAGVDARVIMWANRLVLDLKGAGTLLPFSDIIRANVVAAESLRARVAKSQAILGGPRPHRLVWQQDVVAPHEGHRRRAKRRARGLPRRRLSAKPHERPDASATTPSGFEDRRPRSRRRGDGRRSGVCLVDVRDALGGSFDVERRHLRSRRGKAALQPPAPVLWLPRPDKVQASAETSVQVVRSFPAVKEFRVLESNIPWKTLPAGGVHEVRRTFQSALSAATNYIYIEDQAFDAVESLFPLLVKGCRRGVKVIVVIPGHNDPLEGGEERPRALPAVVQNQIVEPLEDERINLAVWQLRGIFVHSKVLLIDDKFASLGSANFMDRSMQDTTLGDDSELTVAAVSTGTVVSDLRVNLWAEHMRVTDPAALAQIRDLNRSLAFWREDSAWGNRVNLAAQDSPLRWLGPR